MQIDQPIRPPRPRDADGVAAELLRPCRDRPRKVGDHLVGDDHRDRDRDERLTEILSLVPAQQELLHGEAEHADAHHRDEPRNDPLERVDLGRVEPESGPGHPLLDLVRDVAAEEVEGAVRHVDHAHEPEDEREAARDDEEQSGERETVEHGRQERARIVQRRSGVRRSPVTSAELVGRVRDHEHEEDREHDERGRGDARHGSYDSPGANSLGHRPRERTNVAPRFQREPVGPATASGAPRRGRRRARPRRAARRTACSRWRGPPSR